MTEKELLAKWTAKIEAYDRWLDDQGPYPDMNIDIVELRILIDTHVQLREAVKPLVSADAAPNEVAEAVNSAVKRMR